jgi:hypothetical protein
MRACVHVCTLPLSPPFPCLILFFLHNPSFQITIYPVAVYCAFSTTDTLSFLPIAPFNCSYHLFSFFSHLLYYPLLFSVYLFYSLHHLSCFLISFPLILSITLCHHLYHHLFLYISFPHVSSILFEQGIIPV